MKQSRYLPKQKRGRMLKEVKRQHKSSFLPMKYIIPIIAILIGIIGNIVFSSLRSPSSSFTINIAKPSVTPTPTIDERVRTLSKEERATMSGNFIKDLSTYLASPSSGR